MEANICGTTIRLELDIERRSVRRESKPRWLHLCLTVLVRVLADRQLTAGNLHTDPDTVDASDVRALPNGVAGGVAIVTTQVRVRLGRVNQAVIVELLAGVVVVDVSTEAEEIVNGVFD